MRVLFDLVHPAQVHFFKNAIGRLKEGGHAVMVTARGKDVALPLLDSLGIEYRSISEKRGGPLGLAREWWVRAARLYRMAKAFRPDVMVARVGVTAGPVGKLLGVPTVIYDDMEQARLQATVGMSLATTICTGLGYGRDFGVRQVRFNGPPVLAYLAPKYFTPDADRLRRCGVNPDDRLIFIRTVAWGASHDVGRKGSRPGQLRWMVERLSKFGRVLISSEGPLPEELAAWRNPVAVEDVHHLLAFAAIALVEGGTMAAESAVLGTPAVCLQSYNFGYLVALEKQYGLIARAGSVAGALPIAEGLLELPDLRQQWAKKREKLLAESEDVTEFQLRMIERAVKEHPVKWKSK